MKSIGAIQKDINRLKANIESGMFDGINEADVEACLVAPFFEAFEWDTRNPKIVSRQYFTDAHKKIDYVLKMDEKQINVAIEVKRLSEGLSSHIDQLEGYFNTTNADIGILTNGKQYWFFSWNTKAKHMNKTPFAIVDICDIKLHKEDAFLLYFRYDKFDASFFKWFGGADYLSGFLHAPHKYGNMMNKDKRIRRKARKEFTKTLREYRINDYIDANLSGESNADELEKNRKSAKERRMTYKEINALWNYTTYHSRWRYNHNKVIVDPMK